MHQCTRGTTPADQPPPHRACGDLADGRTSARTPQHLRGRGGPGYRGPTPHSPAARGQRHDRQKWCPPCTSAPVEPLPPINRHLTEPVATSQMAELLRGRHNICEVELDPLPGPTPHRPAARGQRHDRQEWCPPCTNAPVEPLPPINRHLTEPVATSQMAELLRGRHNICEVEVDPATGAQPRTAPRRAASVMIARSGARRAPVHPWNHSRRSPPDGTLIRPTLRFRTHRFDWPRPLWGRPLHEHRAGCRDRRAAGLDSRRSRGAGPLPTAERRTAPDRRDSVSGGSGEQDGQRGAAGGRGGGADRTRRARAGSGNRARADGATRSRACPFASGEGRSARPRGPPARPRRPPARPQRAAARPRTSGGPTPTSGGPTPTGAGPTPRAASSTPTSGGSTPTGASSTPTGGGPRRLTPRPLPDASRLDASRARRHARTRQAERAVAAHAVTSRTSRATTFHRPLRRDPAADDRARVRSKVGGVGSVLFVATGIFGAVRRRGSGVR